MFGMKVGQQFEFAQLRISFVAGSVFGSLGLLQPAAASSTTITASNTCSFLPLKKFFENCLFIVII